MTAPRLQRQAMKALTLWQPWASLIAVGLKTIETRSWSAPRSLIGQRIAIHAAKRYPEPFQNDLIGDFKITENIPLGAVVCTVLLAGCVPMTDYATLGDPECIVIHPDGIDHWIPGDEDQSAAYGSAMPDPGAGLIRDITDQRPYGNFAPGRWGWLLVDIEPLNPPIPATGHQGLWNWTP